MELHSKRKPNKIWVDKGKIKLVVDVKHNIFINIGNEVYDKNPKFHVGYYIRISKHKTIFAKGYTLNCYEKVSVIKKIKKYCFMDICY